MTCSIGSVTLVSARASDVEPRQERRSRRRGGHNGGFKPGLILFLIGIAAIVASVAVQSRTPGQTPRAWQASYDCNAMPTIGLAPCK
jgi:hypothetical protein